MADLTLTFGGDLSSSSTGDIAVSDGPSLTQQRVLRRLLTNPGDYIWQLEYGAGLAQFIGQPGAPTAIKGVTSSQLLQESSVANNPAPVIALEGGDDGTFTLTLRYTDLPTQQTNILTFPV